MSVRELSSQRPVTCTKSPVGTSQPSSTDVVTGPAGTAQVQEVWRGSHTNVA